MCPARRVRACLSRAEPDRQYCAAESLKLLRRSGNRELVRSGQPDWHEALDESAARRQPPILCGSLSRCPPVTSKGTAKQNVGPSGSESSHSRPPCASTIVLAIESPRPVPSTFERFLMPRKNLSKISSRSSTGTSTPVL